ncbi:MAG: hypothetical protein ABIQ35_15755, partial [Verrucomicrobiota bacterium]
LAAQSLAGVCRGELKLNPVPLYLAGGVLENNSFVRDSLVTAISTVRPVKLIAPQMSAPLGAVAMALADGGVPVTPSLLETLQFTYREFVAKKSNILHERL